MKKNQILSITLVCVGILLFANAYLEYSGQSEIVDIRQYGGSADWKYYESIEELKLDSDLVITGHIIDSTSEKIVITTADIPRNTMTVTKNTIVVDTVLYGQIETKKIVVHQTGKADNTRTQLANHPLLDENADLLLFLTEIKSGEYSMTGGPQGHYQVQNGRVYSIGEIEERAKETTRGVHQKGTRLTNIENSLGS